MMESPDPTTPTQWPQWPNCATPDCENKQCTWSGTVYCFPCAKRVLGEQELIRRYDATHEITWEEAGRLEAEEDAIYEVWIAE